MKAEIYNILLGVEARNLSPEKAQIKMLELLADRDRCSERTISGEALHRCPLGLYEIFWNEENGGGSSLASIGNLHDGVRWIAPINWTNKNDPTGRMDKCASSIEKIVLLYTK